MEVRPADTAQDGTQSDLTPLQRTRVGHVLYTDVVLVVENGGAHFVSPSSYFSGLIVWRSVGSMSQTLVMPPSMTTADPVW